MANMIKVSTVKLTSTANSMNTTGTSIKTITNQMTNTVNSLSGQVWSGDAANRYKQQFSKLQDDINRMVKMVNEHVSDLNTMAREYEAAENANIQIASTLVGDVII